jgi:hypothetical protein
VSRWTSFLFALGLLSGAACSPCTSQSSALIQPDGGAFRCVTAEDCPRTGNDLVCAISSPADYTSTCVTCQSTQCMRRAVNCP